MRDNATVYGDQRSFTFVSEIKRHGGRAYREHVLGFAGLDRRARATAIQLCALGLRDQAALLLYPEGLDFLTAFLGCLYAEVIAVPAPLPELDASRGARTRKIINDAAISVILTDAAHHPRLTTWLNEVGLARQVKCLVTDTHLDADPGDWAPPKPGPDRMAFLQYTSGSTSDPKGVMVTHGNLRHNAEEIKQVVRGTSDTIGVGWIPHYHDMGLIGQIVAPLYLGCDYVFTSPITFLKRPVLWLELISQHRATNTVAPNFGYDLLCRRVTDQQMQGLDLSSLRTAQNGAEPIRADTLNRLIKRFGSIGLQRNALAPCYGMAETTLLVTGTRAGAGPTVGSFNAAALTRNEAIADTGFSARQLISSGNPVTLDVRIIDPETRAPLPDGGIGEIWVRGGSVTAGYWHRSHETYETFDNVTADGTGPYLRTGDLGFFAEDELYVTGRIKDLIIINGTNIHAHDLEETARTVHPAARAAAAFSLDLHERTAREQVIIIQEISPAAANGTPLADLATLTHDTIARAHQLPALSVVLCARGGVRRTTSGKVQRYQTRQAFLADQITALASHLHPAVAAQLRGTSNQQPRPGPRSQVGD